MKNEENNSNPNQRIVTINKEPVDGKEEKNYYAIINLLALKNAMHTLTPKAFELWIYLSKNQNEFTFYLSKVDFLNWSNVKEQSYYNAFNELKEHNYLIPIDKEKPQPSKYNFYEIPQETEEEPIRVTIHKFWISDIGYTKK